MILQLFILTLNPLLTISSEISEYQNQTLQLCCQRWEYFNISKYKCERISKNANVKWNLTVNFPNKSENGLNIFNDLNHKINLPCEKPEALYWEINKSIPLKSIFNREFCFAQFYLEDTKNYKIVQMDCRFELHLFLAFKHEIIYFFSFVLLIPTLIVYIILKPLNKKLIGKCFMCYLSSVITLHSIFLLSSQLIRINYRLPNFIYISMGFMHFYLNLSIVYWLNVFGFAAWKTFSDTSEELDKYEEKKRFIFYSLYVWSMSALTTAPAVFRNYFEINDNCHKYKQIKSCVMLTYSSLYLDKYFVYTFMAISITNLIIFVIVCWNIYRIRRFSAILVYNQQHVRENTTIFMRLIFLIRPHWFIMYLFKNFKYIDILIFSMNYVESILIFVLFILKKKVLKLLFKIN
ncbi:putative G-protein coupled receptor Mth-like 3 [Cochliomyia hominivorax]